MSKFFEDLADVDDTPKAARPRAKLVKNMGERGCSGCPRKLLWPTLTSPRMAPLGDADADILVLGTAPDKNEDRDGEQFKSAGGRLLRDIIPTRWLERIQFQNVVRCHAPDDINAEVIHSCSIHTEKEVSKHIKLIIGVGQAPLSLYYPGAQIWRIYGTKFVAKIGERLVWYYPVMDPGPMIWMAEEQKRQVTEMPHYHVLRADIRNVFREFEKWPEPTMLDLASTEVLFPDSYTEALELIEGMSEPIGVDWEANGLVPYVKNARMLTAAFSDGKTTIAVPIAHSQADKKWRKSGLELLLWVLANKVWVAHNSAMELKWARFFGPGIKFKTFHDSMALGRLFHHREHGLSLGNMCRIHLGQDIKLLSNLDVKRLDAYPLPEVMRYNGLDALGCRLLYDRLYKAVVAKQKGGYDRLIEAAKSTVNMELIGLPTDQDQARAFDKEWDGIINAAATKIRSLYEVRMYEQKFGKEFNPGSGKQFGEALVTFGGIKLPKTGQGGQYKVDEETLNTIAGDHPFVQAVLTHRGAIKMKSTYIEPVLAVPVLYPDMMLHPGYTTMHTATLRLSGEDPNIQNYPKRKHREIRRMIRAGKGHVIVAVDEGQLEVRILAMASKDPVLVEFIISGKDMHSYWLNKALKAYPDYIDKLAYRTNETDEKLIRKGGRDTIKTDFVFASFYGSGPKSVADRTGIPMHIVLELLEEFWQMFRGVRAWQKARRREYEDTGGVLTLTGRFRHDILNGNEPFNTPIQGTGSDLVVDAQNELYNLSIEEDDPYLAPRINVHDDLTFILPDNDNDLEYYFKRIGRSMTKVRYDWQIVPLMIEAKVGYNWADMEEVYTYTGKYAR